MILGGPQRDAQAIARSIASPRHRRLAELISEHRKGARLTQIEVASRMDRPQSFIANIEAGDRRVDVVELLNFAEAIGFDPAEIIREFVRG